MQIIFSSNDEFEEELLAFRKIDLTTLKKINPKWACGKHSDKIKTHYLLPKFGEYIIVKVKVDDLLKNVEFLDFDVDKLFIDDLSSDYRVMSTLKRWQQNKYVDPLTLSINSSGEKKISISDGRHRFKISNFLKLDKIPVAIYKPSLAIIEKILLVEKF